MRRRRSEGEIETREQVVRVLVACEYSGMVRDAFIARGHAAVSCDILPSDAPGPHLMLDVRDVLAASWDMLLAFPPCTHLAVSGARWWPSKQKEQAESLAFVQTLLDAPISKIAVENPVGKISTAIRKPDQIIQPWQYGHGETKATCLWLKGLPILSPSRIVEGREPRVHREPPGPDRWKRRSTTLAGVAAAMAAQWG